MKPIYAKSQFMQQQKHGIRENNTAKLLLNKYRLYVRTAPNYTHIMSRSPYNFVNP